MKIKHLPYAIDPANNRNHYYETLWKEIGLDLLQKHEPSLEGLTLLDYGSGRGESMDLASNRGMIPSGTDLDPECVERSSKFGPTNILNPDDPLGQFGEKSFDVVTCFHVLEHVPAPKETLTALGKIARKWVVTAVPNLSRIRNMIYKRDRWDAQVNEGHLQSWDHSHFRNLAERHCELELVAWGFDTTSIPPLSNWIVGTLGDKAAIRLETGLFNRLYPFASHSVIALLKPKD
jgi:hypothetical protein